MKKFALIGAALLAVSVVAPAKAADLPVKAVPIAPVWVWTGFYVGGNVGYGWASSNTDVRFLDNVTGVTLATQNQKINLDGWLAGIQAGYNWQAGRMVYGIEADIQATGQKGDAFFSCPAAVCAGGGATPVTASLEQKLPWLGTLRGRIGITGSPILFYLTGGLAYGQVKTNGVITGLSIAPALVSTAFSTSSTKAGWTVGAGVEGRITGNWTAKVEYLYVDLGSVSGGPIATTISPPVRANFLAGAFNSRITDNILRVGLNYNFR